LLLDGCFSSKKSNIHSEIICPNGRKILVKHENAAETYAGIRKFYDIKMRGHTEESYTVIKYKDGYSVQIKKFPPEEMIKCQVRDIYLEDVGFWYDGTSGVSRQ